MGVVPAGADGPGIFFTIILLLLLDEGYTIKRKTFSSVCVLLVPQLVCQSQKADKILMNKQTSAFFAIIVRHTYE